MENHMTSYAIQAGALRENPKSGPDGVGVQTDIAYTLEARAEVQAVCGTPQPANDNLPVAQATGKEISFISMFSGIEAASVAFGPLGWKPICFAEIEKFPSAVLAHHYPDVPNVGDMSKHDWSQYAGKVDIVCGGPPCQDFSIAGLRAGMDGARGSLSITYMRALHAIKPRNAIVENVPGWLNDKKNAFGCFLAGLVGADDPLRTPDGKSWPNAGMVAGPLGRAAWRVLDAQYFNVAQRRRRVLVVADFGNGADPAAVLFEPESVPRHSPPRRETGEDIAPTATECFSASSIGSYREADVSGADRAAGGDNGGGSENLAVFAPEIARCDATREGSSQDYESTTMVAAGVPEIAGTMKACAGKTGGFSNSADHAAAGYMVAISVTGETSHALTAEGADASEDGTGRGTPVVTTSFAWQSSFADQGSEEISGTLIKNQTMAIAQTVAIRGRDGGATAELGGDVATALRASQGGGDKPHVLVNEPAIAFQERGREGGRSLEVNGDISYALTAPSGGGRAQERNICHASAVRRLTPRECERLQGFQWLCSPDYPGAWQDDAGRWWSPDYTAIPWRGKAAADCPDGPRYKALGNSWAVPKFIWLGKRINALMPDAANDNADTQAAA